MTQKFGSGRFCSRSCANGHQVTAEQRVKTANTLRKKLNLPLITQQELVETVKTNKTLACPICDKLLAPRGFYSHYSFCAKQHGVSKYVNYKDTAGNTVVLDITDEDLERYKQEHKTCEICGRTVEEVNHYQGKFAAKQLCVDHDHKTNHFRGMLCQFCNRVLGWYERYEEPLLAYMERSRVEQNLDI